MSSPSTLLLLVAVLPALSAQAPARRGKPADASAALEPVRWTPGTLEGALVEAKERNVPVFIAFYTGGQGSTEPSTGGLHKNREFIALASRCLPLLASDADHGGGSGVCPKFGGVSCSDHRLLAPLVYKRFAEDGEFRTPCHLVLAPSGEVRARFAGASAEADVVGALSEAVSAAKAGLDRTAWLRLREVLADSERASERSDDAAALPGFREILAAIGVGPLADRARSGLARISSQAAASSAEAAALEKGGKAFQAWEKHGETLRKFPGTPAAEEAKRSRARLEKDPSVSREIAAARRAADAHELLQKGLDLEKEGKAEAAAKTYDRVVSKFGDTEAAGRARERLKEIRGG